MTRSVSNAPQELDVEVTGALSSEERRYATEKIASLATYTHKPLRHAHLTVGTSRNPAVAQRVSVSVSLDVDGRALTAKAVGASPREAVDTVRHRLYMQLSRGRNFPVRAYAWVSRPMHRD
jgi:ribosome-associated translation inhibitor RaiA